MGPTPSGRHDLHELLTFIAERIGARAVGMAVVLNDGTTGFLTLAATPTDPAWFGRLSDELYKAAIQAAVASAEKIIRS
jgi:hypothetical protein